MVREKVEQDCILFAPPPSRFMAFALSVRALLAHRRVSLTSLRPLFVLTPGLLVPALALTGTLPRAQAWAKTRRR